MYLILFRYKGQIAEPKEQCKMLALTKKEALEVINFIEKNEGEDIKLYSLTKEKKQPLLKIV